MAKLGIRVVALRSLIKISANAVNYKSNIRVSIHGFGFDEFPETLTRV